MIDNREFSVAGRYLRVAKLEAEWHEDIDDPGSVAKKISASGEQVDLFTFWQRLPHTEPRHNYYMEWDNVAALHIKSFEHWWKKQINAKTRNMIRRAEKKGVEIKLVEFNDELVRGISDIFNETPIRQGKPFWHYKKDLETVRHEMSDRPDKSDFIGAYYDGALIGFIKLLYAGQYAITTQIISKIAHRDKAVNNALISKAVEIGCDKKIPYLVYAKWSSGSLGEFKRHSGFKKIELPRYYIPLTTKGRIALKLQLHHGISEMLPEQLKRFLIDLRAKHNLRKYSLKNLR